MVDGISADDFSKAQEGRASGYLAVTLQSKILDAQNNVLDRLIRSYRGQSLTDHMMIGAIGELTALDDLLIGLESEARRGEAAAERTFKNG